MKKNIAGNEEKGIWGRREVTTQSMMASRTCPLSKDLKEGRVAPGKEDSRQWCHLPKSQGRYWYEKSG